MEKRYEIIVHDNHTITLKSSGNEDHTFQGFVAFFGDAELGAHETVAWGASADAAWAFSQSFIGTHQGRIKGLVSFFRQACCHIVQAIDPAAFQQEVSMEDAVKMWKDTGRVH